MGHSSEAITERHYGAWVKGRQAGATRGGGTAGVSVQVRDANRSKTGRTENDKRKKRQKANELAGK